MDSTNSLKLYERFHFECQLVQLVEVERCRTLLAVVVAPTPQSEIDERKREIHNLLSNIHSKELAILMSTVIDRVRQWPDRKQLVIADAGAVDYGSRVWLIVHSQWVLDESDLEEGEVPPLVKVVTLTTIPESSTSEQHVQFTDASMEFMTVTQPASQGGEKVYREVQACAVVNPTNGRWYHNALTLPIAPKETTDVVLRAELKGIQMALRLAIDRHASGQTAMRYLVYTDAAHAVLGLNQGMSIINGSLTLRERHSDQLFDSSNILRASKLESSKDVAISEYGKPREEPYLDPMKGEQKLLMSVLAMCKYIQYEMGANVKVVWVSKKARLLGNVLADQDAVIWKDRSSTGDADDWTLSQFDEPLDGPKARSLSPDSIKKITLTAERSRRQLIVALLRNGHITRGRYASRSWMNSVPEELLRVALSRWTGDAASKATMTAELARATAARVAMSADESGVLRNSQGRRLLRYED